MQLPGMDPLPTTLAATLDRAVEARGPHYRPRTRHLTADGAPLFTNRLIEASSPYLLQHAHNPVSWWSWSDEAFAEAARRDVPVLLSVGYSTCHWCHVMEHESFEDLDIAAFLNTHFVPIKVDREERPDVDGIYMTAVQLLTGHGGWPMTVALTADRQPFFGGTYFPPHDGVRGARLGFLGILRRLAITYAEDRASVTRAAGDLSRALHEASVPQPGAGVPGPQVVTEAARLLARRFDATWGGFGGAPKFPRPSVFTLLLRHGRSARDAQSIHMVTHTLEQMAAGGMHDQLAGGFHRYSTDERWLVPHFEKMLYDNAQLVVSYLEAWQASGRAPLLDVARSTLAYLQREMTDAHGAFWSATDADSEGEEGLYFTWTEEELEQALGSDDARMAKSYYGVRPGGHYEGRNVLHRPRSDEDVAHEVGLSLDALRAAVARIALALREARGRRVAPLLDDKIITEWNAQAISAFARAARVLDEPRHAEVAARAAAWLLENLRAPDGRLLRTVARHPAVLEDYAFLVAALLDLLEVTGEPRWIEEALALQQLQDRYYLDAEQGGYFTAAADVTGLLVREKPAHDGAQPSGASVSAQNLLRLAELTGDEAHRSRAEGLFTALAPALERGAPAAPLLAAALDHLHDRPQVVVLVTPEGADDAPLRAVLARHHLGPGLIVPVTPGPLQARLAKAIPLVDGKLAIDGKPTAYVCTQGACRLPATDADTLRQALADL